MACLCKPRRSISVPILALARYLLAYPEDSYSGKLFMSSDSYQRFAKILQKTLDDNEELFYTMEMDIDTIATHSARKSAVTCASTDSIVSPPMASICLRAGAWGQWRRNIFIMKRRGVNILDECLVDWMRMALNLVIRLHTLNLVSPWIFVQ